MERRPEATGTRFRAWSVPEALTLLASSAALTWFAWREKFVSDDAFISFRYARNLIEGNGLTFNPGERVEGFSNLLYVLVVALLHAAGMDIVAAGRMVGLAAAIALLAVVFKLAVDLSDGRSRLGAGLATAALGCNAYLAVWSRGGLETTLYGLLVVATIAPLVLHGLTRRSFLSCSLIACALTLTRMEGVAVYALVLLWALAVWRMRGGLRLADLVPGVGAFVLTVALLTAWRLAYYGDPLPNTFAAKAGFTLPLLRRGLAYLGGFSRNLFVIPAALLGLAAAASRRGVAVSLVALLLAGLATIVVGEGGDGLPAYRFVVPLLAPLYILAAAGAAALGSRHRLASVGSLAALTVLIPLSRLMVRDDQFRYYDHHRSFEVPTWTLVGKHLQKVVPPGTVLAAAPIGAVSYYFGLPMIDMLGLTDRHIARRAVATLGSGWAGHEKSDGAYVLSRRPDILLLNNVFTSWQVLGGDGSLPPYTNRSIYNRERDIAGDPLFVREYRYVPFALGGGRFLHAWVRRDSAAAAGNP